MERNGHQDKDQPELLHSMRHSSKSDFFHILPDYLFICNQIFLVNFHFVSPEFCSQQHYQES